MTYQAKLIAGGKIVIPAELRNALGFQVGDSLVLERKGESIVIKTYAQVVREVQKEFRAWLARTSPSISSWRSAKLIGAMRDCRP